MRALLVLSCLVVVFAPVASATSSTVLTVTYDADSTRPGPRTTWSVRCDPLGGTHPRRAAVCQAIDRLGWGAFRPVPRGAVCAELFGGPQVALVTGHVGGRRVYARLSRVDGCQIERWNRIRALLPARGVP